MAESKLRELSTDFAVNIIKLCETIKGHYSLVNQLERSAASIGANIYEANYAHGKPDFIAKLQIALKECYETEYWLELFVKSDVLNEIKNEFDVTYTLEVVPTVYADNTSPCLAPSLKVIDFCHATRTEIDIDLYVMD